MMNFKGREIGKALHVVLVIVSLIALIFGIAGAGAWFGWNRIVSQSPEQWTALASGIFESSPGVALTPEIESLITSVETVLSQAPSRYQAAAKLEQIQWPDDLVYLALRREVPGQFEDELTEVIKRLQWNGHSYRTSNGIGRGTLRVGMEELPVVVVSRQLDAHTFVSKWVAYLRASAGGEADSVSQ